MERKVVEFQQLLERARKGAAPALGEMLASHTHHLMLLAWIRIGRRLRGKIDAHDVVQSTFLKAHRHISRFRGDTEADFLAWLRRILTREVAAVARRHNVGEISLGRDLAARLDESSLGRRPTTPTQHALHREQAVRLAEALSRLPEQYRTVILLRELQGLRFTEVARRTGKSEDSVQKLWTRAMAKLRLLMTQQPKNGRERESTDNRKQSD